jgi:DNA-binding MarR family transcriptional regulator
MSARVETSSTDALARLLMLATGELHHRMRRRGVVPDALSVTLAVWANEGVTESELARRLSIGRRALAEAVLSLERDHVIRRREGRTGDGEAQLYLSRRAKVVESLLLQSLKEVLEDASRGLDPDACAELSASARRMIDNLEREASRRSRS